MLAGCGGSAAPETSTQDTIGLGGRVSPGDQAGTDEPADAGGVSPLANASSCVARISGDLNQQMAPPASFASVRTDRWLSLEQIAALDPVDPGLAPLDGWMTMSCTLPNGDSVSARTLDTTVMDRVPVEPTSHAVAVGLPSEGEQIEDPSGVATFVVLVTLDGILFTPEPGAQVIVTTFDSDDLGVTISAILTEAAPLGAAPRVVTLDASFRTHCGEPYLGCGD